MQNSPRFYVPSLSAGEVFLPEDQAHHARHVLRLHAGSAVELFDGRGASAGGEILRASRNGVTVHVEAVQREDAAKPRLHAAFSVPKGKRLDWLLEKATELSAASIRPIVFERSVAGDDELTDAKRHRWEHHCIAAAKQSGLHWLPELRDAQTLTEFLAENAQTLRLVGDIAPEALPLQEALTGRRPPEDVILLVGPEGGFTPAEKEAIQQAKFQSVRLGTTTLRIETAVVALLAGARAILD